MGSCRHRVLGLPDATANSRRVVTACLRASRGERRGHRHPRERPNWCRNGPGFHARTHLTTEMASAEITRATTGRAERDVGLTHDLRGGAPAAQVLRSSAACEVCAVHVPAAYA